MEKTFEDVIRQAIRKEADAAAFYQMASERVESGISKIFQEMASEERKHRHLLEELDWNKVEQYRLEDIPDLKISEFLEEIPYHDDMGYQDAIRMAIKNEERSHDFYLASAGRFRDDPKLEKLFQMLAQEEAKHKLRLEKVYDDEVYNQKW
ncbi:MAG: ferritin family protein [Deltaproteobacteria bacterium]|nr:ferritin family protein [Deltaproteobacteria bacterium]